MSATSTDGPGQVLERLQQAMNDHHLEHFLDCFHDDYRSEQPAHPDRAFGGLAQVQENWGAVFREVPDFRADMRRTVVDGDSVWTEWAWHGNRLDGSPLEMRGVTLFGVSDGRVAWGRLYMEIVIAGEGIRQAVERLTVADGQR
jgi:ketosteroid isomerase-like protein